MRIMKTKGNFTYLLRNFNHKHRLSVRSQHDDEEVWYMYISPGRLMLAGLGLALVLAAAVAALIIYTPLIDLIPGYPGERSRTELAKGIQRVDSLERVLNGMRVYSDNVRLIMEGKTPVIRTIVRTDEAGTADKTLVPPSAEDSLLRRQMEGSGRYGLQREPARRLPHGLGLVKPVEGRLTAGFDPAAGASGVTVQPDSVQRLLAVREGTVTLALSTPGEGYVLQVQHPGDMLTVYRNATELLKGEGDRVAAGEAVGWYDPSKGEPGGLVFELWEDGRSVDPEKYIAFR